MRFAERVISPANDWVGEVSRIAGMRFAVATAAFSSRFDVKAIDGAVDGLAHGVLGAGDSVRRAQTGRLQQYIAMAVAALFAVLAFVVSY